MALETSSCIQFVGVYAFSMTQHATVDLRYSWLIFAAGDLSLHAFWSDSLISQRFSLRYTLGGVDLCIYMLAGEFISHTRRKDA